MQPLKILQEAIKAVPAMRYALGVAGILAVVAIAAAFKLDPKVAVFGAIITLGLMVVLVIFAKLATVASKHFLIPVLVMMWSFLVLIIAQAALLFSAVSFQKPKALHDWLFAGPQVEAPSVNGPTSGAEPEISPDVLKAAQLQFEADDYAGAWKQITEGLKTAPESQVGRELQARIAMAWLRGRFGYTETELVDMLSPCLYWQANSTNNLRAADAHAHIGWGHYLKSNAGNDLDFVGSFQRALALDSSNTFAHAMWGYCIVWTGEGAGSFREASDHFDAAARTGRERTYVRELQLASLGSPRMDDHVLDFLLVVNGIRLAGETLGAERRDRIISHVYWSEWRKVLTNVNSAQPVLPAAEHLATINWLSEGSKRHYVHRDFFMARLTEQTGDCARALALYRAMAMVENQGVGYSELSKEIEQGIARCTRKA